LLKLLRAVGGFAVAEDAANILAKCDEHVYDTAVMYLKPGEPAGGRAIRSSG
jgi:hypothetical protein